MVSHTSFAVLAFVLLLSTGSSSAQLSPDYYSNSCPQVFSTVRDVVQAAIEAENRMGASLLRLSFHDCFVMGCDASLLLDSTADFTSEKEAKANKNSARGFDVVDMIKAAVEQVCPGVVSCADILAITARDSVVTLGGPYWDVKLGRRDSTTASESLANNNIPPPTSSLSNLIAKFNAQGLSTSEMVALVGAHTIGMARCTNFRNRIYNESNIDPYFAQLRREGCPVSSGDDNLAPLDVCTPTVFDNYYYRNLVAQEGLLHSDQMLYNNGSTDAQVWSYAVHPSAFANDFVAAMTKMSEINPLTGTNGQVRNNCRKINY